MGEIVKKSDFGKKKLFWELTCTEFDHNLKTETSRNKDHPRIEANLINNDEHTLKPA